MSKGAIKNIDMELLGYQLKSLSTALDNDTIPEKIKGPITGLVKLLSTVEEGSNLVSVAKIEADRDVFLQNMMFAQDRIAALEDALTTIKEQMSHRKGNGENYDGRYDLFLPIIEKVLKG